MNRIAKFLTIGAFLASLAGSHAQTNTNLEYWVQDLNISLTGSTNGVRTTNGIIASVRAGAVKITSKDVIRSLYNQFVMTIGKEITNYTVFVTNQVSGPDIVITNHVVQAFPVYSALFKSSYSPQARLLFLEPLSNNLADSLVVIRDGNPPVDYMVNNFLQISTVSFDNRADASVVTGKFDVSHDLVSATESSIRRYKFDATGLGQGLLFDVQGLTTERKFSLIERANIVDNEVTRSAVSTVAGTGQIPDASGFCVLHGTISFTGGKHEVK